MIGAIGAGLTALIVGLLLSRQFLHPLSEFTRAITAMRAGDLDQRVDIRTQDELGVLAQAFNEMSADLHRANQLRKQMTADVAHDLRTPLTVIGGYLEALQDGTLKPTSERFRIMGEEVSLLQHLVEDLRTLSLADADELKLTCAPVSLCDMLVQVAESFQESATATGQIIQVECQPTIEAVWIDHKRIAQVLGNLITNAIRHTPASGTITLIGAQQADQFILKVKDTGSGIAPADLPKIFDRFYRVDPSRQTSNGESGLGLAIAKSIVEAHRGTLMVESQVGQGTTMLITLPNSWHL